MPDGDGAIGAEACRVQWRALTGRTNPSSPTGRDVVGGITGASPQCRNWEPHAHMLSDTTMVTARRACLPLVFEPELAPADRSPCATEFRLTSKGVADTMPDESPPATDLAVERLTLLDTTTETQRLGLVRAS